MAICSNCGAQVPDGAPFCGNCGAPQAAAPAQPAQPAQPMYAGGYRQQAQQAQPGYNAGNFGAKAKGFFSKFTSAPNGPLNYGLLRILSLVFAFGFLLLSIGIGTGIYKNRCFDESNAAEQKSRYKSIIAEYLNVGTNTKALRNAAKRLDKYNNTTRDNEAYSKSDKDENIKDALEKALDKAKEDNGGFNWFMMKVGLRSGAFIWIGIILMLLTGAAWWFFGGRPGNFSQAFVLPATLGVLAFFVILFILCLSLGAVDFRTYLRTLTSISLT